MLIRPDIFGFLEQLQKHLPPGFDLEKTARVRRALARARCDSDLPAWCRSHDVAPPCRLRSGEQTSGSYRVDRRTWWREPSAPDVPARRDRAGRSWLCEG